MSKDERKYDYSIEAEMDYILEKLTDSSYGTEEYINGIKAYSDFNVIKEKRKETNANICFGAIKSLSCLIASFSIAYYVIKRS